ncbi:MAG: vitamin K epoxide reductase family protein [Deferribacterota bacterium]|nr:vitamin K epoxide reductase family protein [Deferribacterota bacterium]
MKNKTLLLLLIFFSFIGIVDSIYLTHKGPHFELFEQICTNNVCDEFNIYIFGIELAVYGIFYYLTILALSLYNLYFYLSTNQKHFNTKTVILELIIVVIGLLCSLFFLYYQLAVIGGYCIYCLISLFTTIIIFLLVLIIMYTNKGEKLWIAKKIKI